MSLCFMTISTRPSHHINWRVLSACCYSTLQEESGRILKPEGDFELAFGTHTWSSGKGSE